jgi:DNA-binding PadR family transcriptional regulator
MRPTSLVAERHQILAALAADSLASSAIARRLPAPSADSDQSLLFPALHSLEADGRLTAEWRLGTDGRPRRTYRRRRLIPVRIAR